MVQALKLPHNHRHNSASAGVNEASRVTGAMLRAVDVSPVAKLLHDACWVKLYRKSTQPLNKVDGAAWVDMFKTPDVVPVLSMVRIGVVTPCVVAPTDAFFHKSLPFVLLKSTLAVVVVDMYWLPLASVTVIWSVLAMKNWTGTVTDAAAASAICG